MRLPLVTAAVLAIAIITMSGLPAVHAEGQKAGTPVPAAPAAVLKQKLAVCDGLVSLLTDTLNGPVLDLAPRPGTDLPALAEDDVTLHPLGGNDLLQGLDPNTITATGYGKSNPVASNDTAEGRQQNRRVELVISGEVIGVEIGVPIAAR